MLGPYAIVFYWILAQKGSWLCLGVLLTMPLALKAMKILHLHYQTYDEIIPAQALTIQTHLALGLVLSAALVAHKLVF
jgi:1,4-dihydroxy-2-naphthoate octaprenyltransferase